VKLRAGGRVTDLKHQFDNDDEADRDDRASQRARSSRISISLRC